MIEFSQYEVIALQKCPEALDQLINIHECWIVEAESIGDYEESIKVNERRIVELKAERDRLIAEYY